MCGIAGSTQKIQKIAEHLKHRGTDNHTIRENNNLSYAHALHSIVNYVEQPTGQKNHLIANCEIYNWKKLAEKHNIEAENDAELLAKLLTQKKVEKVLKQLDGVYAFAYIKENEVILARDKMGVKPLWYSQQNGEFYFASEKQALEKEDIQARELHPRKILKYNLEDQKLTSGNREFYQIKENEDKTEEEFVEEIEKLFLEAVEKRIPKDREIALLFSGGLDSSLVAKALQKKNADFTCYTAGIQHGNVDAPRDIEWAKKTAQKMNLDLEIYEAKLEEVEKTLPQITDWISTTSVVKNGVALPFHFSLKEAKGKVVMTGLGSEQLYAGYSRHEGYLNKECLSGLRNIWHKDMYRDDVISMRNGFELRIPFLDQKLVQQALTIPGEHKVTEKYRKYILRKLAEKWNLPEDVTWRKKTAAQYGSNFDKAIDRISRNKDFNHKQEYLNSLKKQPNKRLAALTSGGKDSNAALYRMHRRNNQISCLLHITSENKESYMYDSRKTTETIQKQAKKLNKPLIIQETDGVKEEELKALEKGLEKAIREYDIEGVIAGALASTYQRDRVERTAEKTGLKVFSPLWQENQERYMKWLIREGFEIKITSVAARGLTKEWVGTVLNERNVEELNELSEEYGFNAAGEGGEYETEVVGFPSLLV